MPLSLRENVCNVSVRMYVELRILHYATSAKEDIVSLSVCSFVSLSLFLSLFVCQQLNVKITNRIFAKLFTRERRVCGQETANYISKLIQIRIQELFSMIHHRCEIAHFNCFP